MQLLYEKTVSWQQHQVTLPGMEKSLILSHIHLSKFFLANYIVQCKIQHYNKVHVHQCQAQKTFEI